MNVVSVFLGMVIWCYIGVLGGRVLWGLWWCEGVTEHLSGGGEVLRRGEADEENSLWVDLKQITSFDEGVLDASGWGEAMPEEESATVSHFCCVKMLIEVHKLAHVHVYRMIYTCTELHDYIYIIIIIVTINTQIKKCCRN